MYLVVILQSFKAVTILLFLCGFRAVHVGDEYEKATEPYRHSVYSKWSTGTDMIKRYSSVSAQQIGRWKNNSDLQGILYSSNVFNIDQMEILDITLFYSNISENTVLYY